MTGLVRDKHKSIKALLHDSLANNAHDARLENDVNILDYWKPDYKRRDKKLTSVTVQELSPIVLTVNVGLKEDIQLGSEEGTVAGSGKTIQKRKMLGIWTEF